MASPRSDTGRRLPLRRDRRQAGGALTPAVCWTGTFDGGDAITAAPSRPALVDALSMAAEAHHEYESIGLAGVRDEAWPGFYAAFVLGRLGPFMPPSRLVTVLESVTATSDWAEAAAGDVLAHLAGRPPATE